MDTTHKKNKKIVLGMKNNIINKLTPLLLLVFVFQACSDDFLDQTDPNALTTASFWENTSDLNSGLNSTYSALKDENISGILFDFFRTDIAVKNSFRNSGEVDPFYGQSFDLTTTEIENQWNALYLGIFRANQVIVNYEELKSSFNTDEIEEEGLRIVAQARAIRGYLYYILSTTYNNGEVPLLDFVPADFDEFQQAMSPSQTVKDFYRADLQFGLENLPATYSAWEDVGKDNLGRVTGGFCEAMLGKSYLMENNFGEAKIYLKNVIDNYGYALVPNIEDCVTGINEFSSESIFEVNYTTDLNLVEDGEKELSHKVTHQLSNGNVQPSSWLTLQYRNDPVDPADPENMNLGANVYDTSNGEITGTEDRLRTYSLRMGTSMVSVDDPDSPIYGVPAGELGNADDVSPLARTRPNLFKKFTHWNTIGSGAGEDRSTEFNNKSDINLPVIRLADVYLMYAECMIEEANLAEALRYINRVRKRSHLLLLGKSTEAGAEYVNATTTYVDDIDFDSSNGEEEVTLTNLMDHLRFTERPLELALEGSRVANLRRWGVFKSQLEHIASIRYDYWHFNKNLNGKHGDRYKCFITVSGEEPTTYTGTSVTNQPIEVQDAVLGATNFQIDAHGYFPIPQAEVDTNLNWNTTE
ncbi:hypothetical protein FHR24_002372 [Wenyingzhuangia heitensis]|uniref:Starch-binding associating with outer membrane n=1 Tax=Wenyingzhuangia heitensis TaxID=1487859 RepID=A0ABX0UFE9_9FLAO|nr:RagB/SusD family nutrient uptake outer membrane protein [Wenyingzhuangia heitensis]NIJ45901.1 hypothetical protein [Wenyingzhuangia heitensis]